MKERDKLWEEREELLKFESIEPLSECLCADFGEEECPIHRHTEECITNEQVEKLSKKRKNHKIYNKEKKRLKKESRSDIQSLD